MLLNSSRRRVYMISASSIDKIPVPGKMRREMNSRRFLAATKIL